MPKHKNKNDFYQFLFMSDLDFEKISNEIAKKILQNKEFIEELEEIIKEKIGALLEGF